MIIWYRNSILASVVSIVSCAMIIVMIGGIKAGELTVPEAVLGFLVSGSGIVLGRYLSVRKERKKEDHTEAYTEVKRRPIIMADTIQCSNCKQSVSSDNRFCIFCGAKLPDILISPESSASFGDTSGMKICKNGHRFNDPGLCYCPICGLPIEGGGVVASTPLAVTAPSSAHTKTVSGWKCTCGYLNPSDNVYCEACSRPKEPKPRAASSAEEISATGIPEGMYAPTAADIMPKRKRQ